MCPMLMLAGVLSVTSGSCLQQQDAHAVMGIRIGCKTKSLAGFSGFWVFGFLGFWVFGYLGIWDFGFLGFGFRVFLTCPMQLEQGLY